MAWVLIILFWASYLYWVILMWRGIRNNHELIQTLDKLRIKNNEEIEKYFKNHKRKISRKANQDTVNKLRNRVDSWQQAIERGDKKDKELEKKINGLNKSLNKLQPKTKGGYLSQEPPKTPTPKKALEKSIKEVMKKVRAPKITENDVPAKPKIMLWDEKDKTLKEVKKVPKGAVAISDTVDKHLDNQDFVDIEKGIIRIIGDEYDTRTNSFVRSLPAIKKHLTAGKSFRQASLEVGEPHWYIKSWRARYSIVKAMTNKWKKEGSDAKTTS